MKKRVVSLFLTGLILCSLSVTEVWAEALPVQSQSMSADQETAADCAVDMQENELAGSDGQEGKESENSSVQQKDEAEASATKQEHLSDDSEIQQEEAAESAEIQSEETKKQELSGQEHQSEEKSSQEKEASQSEIALFSENVTRAAAIPYYSYTPAYVKPVSVKLSPSSVTYAKMLSEAIEMIGINEGSYTTVVKNDNGALSIGKVQWHAGNALELLKAIISKNNKNAYSLLGASLYNEIINSHGWSSRILNDSEASKIAKLLATSESKTVQDRMAESYVTSYLNHGINMGIRNAAALIYFADVENQGGAGSSAQCAKYAYNLAGSYSNITLNELHLATICYSYSGKNSWLASASNRRIYNARRMRTYGFCTELGWTYCKSGDSAIPYASPWTSPYIGTQWLQKVLNTYQKAGLSVDGSYGNATKNAVKKFQKSVSLSADGNAGLDTMCMLIYKVYYQKSVYAQGSVPDTTGGGVTIASGRKAAKITVTASSYSVNDNHGSIKLGAKSNHSQKPLTYKSSNTAVAAVNSSGTVTVKKAGTAKITISQAQSANYNAVSLVVTLKIYSTNPSSYKAPTATLSSGRSMAKTSVQWLQAVLMKLGYSKEVIDGIWDSATTASVKKFQKAYKLDVDGSVGPATRKALNTALALANRKSTVITASASYAANDDKGSFLLNAKSNQKETKMTYKSSNTAVAAVSSSGKVTVKKAGTAKITISQAASSHYKAATKTVKVTIYSTKPSSYKAPTTTLSSGRNMTKTSVQWLQAALHKLGYSTQLINGTWNSTTTTAVKKFQKAYKLDVDGSVGPATRKAIQKKL